MLCCSQPSVEQKQSTTDAAETVIADEMCSFAPIDSNDQSDAAVMIDKAIQSVVDSASRMEEPNDAEQFETASYLADWVTEQMRMEKEADDRLQQAYLKSLHRQIKRPLRTAMDEALIKILGKAHVKKLHLRIKRPVGAEMDELLDTILNKASYAEIHLFLKLASKLHQPQHLPHRLFCMPAWRRPPKATRGPRGRPKNNDPARVEWVMQTL